MSRPLTGDALRIHRQRQRGLIRRLFGNGPPTLAQDRDFRRQRTAWAHSRRAETHYATQLRKLVRNIEFIISGGVDQENPTDTSVIEQMLLAYANLITPWAETTAERMLADIDQRGRRAWAQHSRTMSRALAEEIETAPTGAILRQLQQEQVTLIKSLPLQAAERVHEAAQRGILNASRGEDIVADIMRTGLVTRSRAVCIARTETSRVASNLTEARARYVGSVKYIWRTADDVDVRDDHKKLNGKVFEWNNPPIADKRAGVKAHPGTIYNCFPGSTTVNLANGCHRIWRSDYLGPIVVLEFNGGVVETTPNHPVLSNRGWIAAKSLNEGDYLIQSVTNSNLVLDENRQHRDPTFEEVFEALSPFGLDSVRPGHLFDFHGDIPDGHVNEIRADHLLPGDGETEVFKRICDFAFADADGRIVDGNIAGGGNHVVETLGSGLGDDACSLFGARATEPDLVGFTAVAPFDIVAQKDFSDDHSGASVFSGQSKFAHSSSVIADNVALRKVCSAVRRGFSSPLNCDTTSPEKLADVVRVKSDSIGSIFKRGASSYRGLRLINKRISSFSGHVYTLQSLSGWFSVSNAGIIVKNCRCYAEPIIPDEF
jgi:SPP1 gp7 family putative phage head morphogenesis protein